jgi:hypothetical protein
MALTERVHSKGAITPERNIFLLMKGNDGYYADADEEEEESQADVGLTQNVEPLKYCRFDLGTSNDNSYKGEDGGDADEEEYASQADDGSTHNLED